MQKLLPRQHLRRVTFVPPQDMCKSDAATASEAPYSWDDDNRVSHVCTLNVIMHICQLQRASMNPHTGKEVSSFG